MAITRSCRACGCGGRRDTIATCAVITASSGGRTFCFLSDLVPTVNHTQPTWVAAFDLYPMQTIDQKAEWLGRAADEGWICGFGHDPKVGFARIERDEKRQFRAASRLP